MRTQQEWKTLLCMMRIQLLVVSWWCDVYDFNFLLLPLFYHYVNFSYFLPVIIAVAHDDVCGCIELVIVVWTCIIPTYFLLWLSDCYHWVISHDNDDDDCGDNTYSACIQLSVCLPLINLWVACLLSLVFYMMMMCTVCVFNFLFEMLI